MNLNDEKREEFLSTDEIRDTESIHSPNRIYHLQLLQKRKDASNRPVLPVTKQQKLSYLRAHSSYSAKSGVIFMQHWTFNKHLWNSFCNLVFECLPMSYIYIFLGSYAPQHHFFLQKMVPLFRLTSLIFILAGILDLLAMTDGLLLMMDYIFFGIIEQFPWHRCQQDSETIVLYPNESTTYMCYEISDFLKKYNNKTVTCYYYQEICQSSDTYELFKLAPVIYFQKTELLIKYRYYGINRFIIYSSLLWIVAVIFYKQIYKKYIWIVMHYSIMILTAVYFLLLFEIVIHYILDGYFDYGYNTTLAKSDFEYPQNQDLHFLFESMTTPSIVHLLTSRSKNVNIDEINASAESAYLSFSNAFYYFIKGLLTYNMRKIADKTMGIPVSILNYNPFDLLYLWPIYFTRFYIGNLATIGLLSLTFIVDMLAYIITFQCLVDVIYHECPKLRLCGTTILVAALGFSIGFFTSYLDRFFLYIFSKLIPSVLEIVIMFMIYPLDRLFEDTTFHYGVHLTIVRKFITGTVPYFYLIKYVLLTLSIFEVIAHQNIVSYSFFIMTLIGGVAGAIIAASVVREVYVYIYKQKKSWKMLFVPYPDWGPRDFLTRQLRKQFDIRYYIGSQAPKMLSRHLIKKAESKVYRLDIVYNVGRKSQNDKNDVLSYEQEKKDE